MAVKRRQRGRPPSSDTLHIPRDPFVRALREACESAHAAEGSGSLTRQRLLTEDSFFRAAVALEQFLSDWMVRCLASDTSRLRRHVEGLLRKQAEKHVRTLADDQSVVGRAAQVQTPSVRVELPLSTPVALGTAAKILGCSESVKSFAGAAEFKEWAGKYLADPRARATGELDATQDAILDATLALRNLLAHRSPRATIRVNQTLRSPDLPGDLRIGRNDVTPAGVGRYLCAAPSGRARFEVYFSELALIAYTLAKTRGRRLRICP